MYLNRILVFRIVLHLQWGATTQLISLNSNTQRTTACHQAIVATLTHT